MYQQGLLRYLEFLLFVPLVTAISHKYSLANSSTVRYTDISAYIEEISTMQCLALCDGTDNCTSFNYNLDMERCELTPHVPRTKTPSSAAEPNWRVYFSDRIVTPFAAWQQSTFSNMNAEYAIDGNRINIDVEGYLYCAHTLDVSSYLAMEFAEVAEVEYVIIVFRNYVNQNFWNQNLQLLISTTREDSDNNVGKECAFYAGPPASPAVPVKIMCTEPVTGKFLKIQQSYGTYLVICEVEVYHT